MHANFTRVFPNGITLGCNERKIKFTTAQAVTNWLPAGTNNYELPEGTLTNPSNSTFNSNLVAQLLSVRLSVSFDSADVNFASGTNTLGDMYYLDAPFTGKTVKQIIEEANRLIGGCNSSYSRTQLQVALENINLNYDGSGVDLHHLDCLNPNSSTNTGSGGTGGSGGCGDDDDDDDDNRSSSTPITRISNTNQFEVAAALYPNPATETVNVVIAGNIGEKAVISIYEMNGKVVYSNVVTLNKSKSIYNVQVKTLSNQTYIVKVSTASSITTSKLVVQH